MKKQIRKEYKLSLQEMDNLLKACNPPPVAMRPAPGQPTPLNAQERANIAWTSLGKKLGFDPASVEPLHEKGPFYFTAVPIEHAFQDVEFTEVSNDQANQAT